MEFTTPEALVFFPEVGSSRGNVPVILVPGLISWMELSGYLLRHTFFTIIFGPNLAL